MKTWLVLTSREFKGRTRIKLSLAPRGGRHPVTSSQRRSPHLRRALMFLPWICRRSSEQLKSKGCDFGKTVRSHRLSLGAGVIRKYGALVSHARRGASALTAKEGRRAAPAPLPTACRASHGLGGELGYSREESDSARVFWREQDGWSGVLDVSARHKTNAGIIHAEGFIRRRRQLHLVADVV